MQKSHNFFSKLTNSAARCLSWECTLYDWISGSLSTALWDSHTFNFQPLWSQRHPAPKPLRLCARLPAVCLGLAQRTALAEMQSLRSGDLQHPLGSISWDSDLSWRWPYQVGSLKYLSAGLINLIFKSNLNQHQVSSSFTSKVLEKVKTT